MPNKHRGDIDFRFAEGAFRSVSNTTPLQLYRVFECEPQVNKRVELDSREYGGVLLYCSSGAGVLNTQDKSMAVSANMICFLPAGNYSLEKSSDTPFRCACIVVGMFSSAQNSRFLELSDCAAFFSSLKSPVSVYASSAFAQAFSSFLDELSYTSPIQLLLQNQFYKIMFLASRCFLNHAVSGATDTLNSHAVGHTVYAIIRYIDDHLFSMNNLMDMAKELGYSYNYLSHLFRRKTGMTIQMYVNRKKIEISTAYLEDESYSITEIASMLNYDCIQSFSKAFRRAMGMSPTEYRALHCSNSKIDI